MRIIPFILFFVTSCSFHAACAPHSDPHLYDQISAAYLATYPLTDEAQHTGLSLDMPHLSDRKKAQIGFNLLKEDEERYGVTTPSSVIDAETWKSLELFANSFEKPDATVVSALDRTRTTMGRIALTKLLASPLTNTSILKKRQAFLARLLNDDTLFTQLDTLLTDYAKHESSLLSLTQPNDPLLQKDLQNLFYTGNVFSISPTAMSLQKHLDDALFVGVSSMSILAALSFALLIWSYHHRNEWQDFSTGRKALLCGTPFFFLGALFFEYRSMRSLRKAYNYMRRRMRAGHHFYTLMDEVHALNKQYHISSLHSITPPRPAQESNEAKKLRTYLTNDSFLSNRFLFSNSRPLFGAYPLICKHASELFYGIHILGIIDAYLSLARLIKEHQATPVTYSFVEYLSEDTPHISAADFWHPALSPKRAVPNSVELGSAHEHQNIVITGVNAGGKSTVMKALTLSLILGQTCGIAPARSLAFTPFHKINTFLNITDDSSEGNSLFMAELERADQLITDITRMPANHHCFTLLDEIFTATEYVEGEAGAYGVARRLADFPQNMTVLATHFAGLTALAQETHRTNARYENMKVIAAVNDDGTLTRDEHGKFVYPYTLTPGISHQQIALDILAQKNFHAGALAVARDVLAHPDEYTPTERDR